MELAEVSTVTFGGHPLSLYRWGSGPRVILLVHGWEGRASDFAAIVRELKSRERTIIALDAPGHGVSRGLRTNVIDYGAILADVARRFGRFDAVISHSLGTPSVAAAAADGLTADRYVSISGVADLGNLVPKFCSTLGLRPAMIARVRTRVEDRVFDGDRDVWGRYSAESSPIPPGFPLLVMHDRGDRMIAVQDSAAIAAAHGPDSRLVMTEGFGHNRILSADLVLDEIASFLHTRVGAPATALY